jgi:hypothetical protein
VGATVSRVDVSYDIGHTYSGDLDMLLIAPNGASVTLRDNTGGSVDCGCTEQFTLDGAFVGVPVDGTWILRVVDGFAEDAGTIRDVAITVHYAGGAPPIPATSAFESTVRDLGADPVTSIDAITWTERLPVGSDLAVRLRTCATPEDCAGAAWSDPVSTPGNPPTVAPARYLQYRIELTSDGDRAPALERLQIDYQVAL